MQSTPTRRRRWRRLRARIVLLAVSLLGAGVLLEGATRVFFDAPSPAEKIFVLTMSKPHPARIWVYKPRYGQRHVADGFDIFIKTNSWGLRDREPNPKADLRILAIGDSFTFGWGVGNGQGYSEVLEEELGARFPELTIEVLNAGHWMYAFDQQYLLLAELIGRYRPQVVLQGFYAPQVLTIDKHAWTRTADGDIESIHSASFHNELQVGPDGAIRRVNRLIQDPPLASRFVSELAKRFYRWRQIHAASPNLLSLYTAGDDRNEEAWRMVDESIRRAVELARAHDAAYLGIRIPHDIAVSEEEWSQWTYADPGYRHADWNRPAERFRAIVEDAGGDYVDLLGAFRRSYSPELYFAEDPHWKAAGHRLAAAELLPHVLRLSRDALGEAGAH